MNMKMGFHWRPAESSKVVSKISGAVVYLSKGAKSGRPSAVGYRSAEGKTMAFNYTFKDEARRAEYVAEFFRGCDATVARRAERAAVRKAELAKGHNLKMGDVLSGSWGYDQTNTEWYEVTAVIGKRMVEIRELACESETTGFMCGQSVPLPGNYCGEAKRRMVEVGDRVKLHSSCGLRKVEKQKVAGVDAGYRAAYWSSYA